MERDEAAGRDTENVPASTILVVDDTVASLRLFSSILGSQGYGVITAPNGEQALAAAGECPPDLVLLDINMPGMDGYEVCHRLKRDESTRAVPVIFISGMNDVLDKVEAFKAGGVDYITKPFQVEEVLARVHTHLTLQRLQHQLEVRVGERTAELSRKTIQVEEVNQVLQQKTEELEQLNRAMRRFVPRPFLELLKGRRIDEIKFTDLRLSEQIQKNMTIMFADIRNFTALSENMNPQENFDFITSYLARLSPAIRKRAGFVDKYMGDGVMALFPRTPQDAVEAALLMRKVLEIYNRHRSKRGYPPVDIGTGLHYGSLIMGVTGEAERWEGTVISDSVNLASRLEGLTKFFGANIIVSEETLARVDLEEVDLRLDDELSLGEHLADEAENDRCTSRRLAKVQVNGKTEMILIHEILFRRSDGSFDDKVDTKPDFEEGLDLYYGRHFAEAAVKFKGVLDRIPDDKAARLYLERAALNMVRDVPADWTGIEEILEK